jgi:hypothetical protein
VGDGTAEERFPAYALKANDAWCYVYRAVDGRGPKMTAGRRTLQRSLQAGAWPATIEQWVAHEL